MSTPRDLETWLDEFREHLLALDVRRRAVSRRPHTRLSDHRGASHARRRRARLPAPAPPPKDPLVVRAPAPRPQPLRDRVELRGAAAPAPPVAREPAAPWEEPARVVVAPAPLPRLPARSVGSRPRLRFDVDPGAGGWRASLATFVLAWAAYGVLGWHIVTIQHVVPFDALARMTHSYLVWHDDPAKLTAIGFVWPPVQTLAYLPFTLFRGMATSLVALPLATACFAAATLTSLGRTLRVLRLGAGWQALLLLLFAVNPLFVFYAVNGMAEMLTLFLLAGFAHFVVRWLQSDHAGWLLLAGTLGALLVLSRYETLLYVLAAAGGIAVLLHRRRTRLLESEGTLVGFLSPMVYAVGVWIMFNTLLVGAPLGWLTKAGGQSIGAAPKDGSPWALLAAVSEVATRISLLGPLAFGGLLIVALARRSDRAATLALLVALNAVITLLLFAKEAGVELLQPRYNMRILPLALIGVAWVAYELLGRGRTRTLWLAGSVVVAALSLPVCWRMMEHDPRQYEESAFVQAVTHWHTDQEGTTSVEGYPIGLRGEREMAAFIRANVDGRHQILTDDSLTLGVILLSDDPGRFYDRIQRGDGMWHAVLDAPQSEVGYVLVTTPQGCRPQPPFCEDLIRDQYPQLLAGKVPWAHRVYATDTDVLFRVDRR